MIDYWLYDQFIDYMIDWHIDMIYLLILCLNWQIDDMIDLSLKLATYSIVIDWSSSNWFNRLGAAGGEREVAGGRQEDIQYFHLFRGKGSRKINIFFVDSPLRPLDPPPRLICQKNGYNLKK